MELPMSESTPSRIPPRRTYGDGVFVRSLAIRRVSPGKISLAMEDPVHAFTIEFEHTDDVVKSVDVTWVRSPFSSCGGASNALTAMVGCKLEDNVFDVARYTEASHQCTHLHDMLCLAVTHAYERRPDYRYDLVVPDSVRGTQVATLSRDGQVLLHFEVEDYRRVIEPEACRGLDVRKGFMSWVRANVPGAQQEHYVMMQRGLFVARSQQVDLESLVGQRALPFGPPVGVCFGSQPKRYGDAMRVSVPRRFNRETVGETLRFFDPD
jgi:hypothetical protein